MVVVLMRIEFNGGGNNHISVDLLDREDANDMEREMGRNTQNLIAAALQAVADQMPEGEVTITVTEIK